MTAKRLVAAPDKFRGTLSAAAAAAAICDGVSAAGWIGEPVPVSDGGDGLLDCVGGANRTTTVSGPLGTAVPAGWRIDGDRAVVEMATASGLALVGDRNDPVAATTTGTGELIAAAIDAGARFVVVGAGGSATTDGGLGAVESLAARGGIPSDVDIVIAVDVTTRFVDAARTFAPQKGATPAQVDVLEQRLHNLAESYRDRFNLDVTSIPGSGAAGGLAGGLAALGATIRPGFAVVAELIDLPARIRDADLVLTGEGRLDATSLLGKAPVGVARLCAELGVAVAVIAGDVDHAVDPELAAAGLVHVVSLTDRFGAHAARTDTAACLRTVTAEIVDTA